MIIVSPDPSIPRQERDRDDAMANFNRDLVVKVTKTVDTTVTPNQEIWTWKVPARYVLPYGLRAWNSKKEKREYKTAKTHHVSASQANLPRAKAPATSATPSPLLTINASPMNNWLRWIQLLVLVTATFQWFYTSSNMLLLTRLVHFFSN